MFLGRIILHGLSKSSPLTNRNFCSVTAAAVARYPLGRDLWELETDELEPHESISLHGRPVSLPYRIKTMLELSDLDGAATLARLAAVSEEPDTLVIGNTVIKAMIHEKRNLDGISLFHYLFNTLNIVPNIVSFNLVIKAFCELDRVDDALQLYRHALNFGADKETYRLLTEGLVKDYGSDEAWSFADKTTTMRDEMVLFSLVRGDLDEMMEDDDVDEYFDKWRLELHGKVFSSFATIFVDYWFKRGNEEKAMNCYNCIPNWTCSTLCVTTGNTLLEILLANGKKLEAWTLFNRMITNYRFDSKTVNVMVDECFKLGEFEKAMETFKESQKKKRMVGCYSNMVAKLCEFGMVSEAELLFEKMCSSDDKDLSPDHVSIFRSMVCGYVRAGRVNDALDISRKLAILNLSKVSIYQDPR